MNTYTYFTAVVKDAGMQNSSRLAIAIGIHMRSSQILALPCFDFVYDASHDQVADTVKYF